MAVITSNVVTMLNYRITVFSWSDFYRIQEFQEVDHDQWISEVIFSAADDWLANTGINTTYSVMSAGMNTTSCEIWPTDGSEGSADPEPPEIGSVREDKDINIINAIIVLNYCRNSTIIINAIIIRFCYLNSQISSYWPLALIRKLLKVFQMQIKEWLTGDGNKMKPERITLIWMKLYGASGHSSATE